MKTKITTLAIFFIFLACFGFAQTIRYVKAGGSGDGSTWANASGDLQDIINKSAANDQIWVAKGSYLPNRKANNLGTITPNDIDNAFVLKADVKLYGGFSDTGTPTMVDRNWNSYPTILSGDFSGNDNVTGSGASLSITNNTENAYHVVISAAAVGTTELNGFTITGGNAYANGYVTVNGRNILRNRGGGIYNDNSSPTLTNVSISGNSAYSGGGMNNQSSSPILTNVSLSDNSAYRGGGMYNANSSPTLTNVSLSGNNAAYSGGGMYNFLSSFTLTNVSINGNSSAVNGGGMFNQDSSPTLTNVSLSGNSAASTGGGMHNNDSSPTLTNVSISGNSAASNGAIVVNDSGSQTKLINCTVVGNSNAQTLFYNGNTAIQISNSIIFSNTVAQLFNWGSVSNNNLVQGSSSTTNGNVDATNITAADIFTNPSTGDYTLKTGSVAIGAGSNTEYTNAGGNLTTDKDLAGNSRLQKLIIDMGAYESAYNTPPAVPAGGIVYVKKGATGKGNSWANAIGELADAMLAAKTLNATTAGTVKQIWVAGGTYKPLYSPADNNFGTDQGRDNAFLMVNDVKVYGGFAGTETTLTQRDLAIVANKSTLSGDFSGNDNVTGSGSSLSITNNTENAYHVVISAAAVGAAELNGFTITGGNANVSNSITVNNQDIARFRGGGIYNNSSSPTLTNLSLNGNSAINNGGGIYSDSSSPTLTNLSLNGNSSAFGGGMLNVNSSPIVSNSIFNNNMANSLGGGMYNMNSSPIVSNSIFNNNMANSEGGGMFNYNSSPIVNNSIFSNNTASVDGSGIHNNSGSGIFTNVTLVNNSNSGFFADGYTYWKNSIIWDNINGTGYQTMNCLIKGNTNAANGNIVPGSITADDIFTNPNTNDYTLKLGSPAIDAGNNTFFTGLDANTKDLAGMPRLKGSAIDMGAYELQSQPQSITATNLIKTYGDASFEPGATASSGLTVSYASADNTIAEAYQDATDSNKWKLKIKKAGTVNITASQPGGLDYDTAPDQIFSVTIQPKALIITASGINKVYNGNTAATVTLANNALTGDVVNAGYTMAVFDNKNIGNGKPISVTGISLSGADAGNYSASTSANTTANITTLALTITATGNHKVYDGNTSATVTLASNAITGDALNTSYTAAVFDNKNVGNAKPISVTGISLLGADAGNYTFNTTTNTTANITAKAIAVLAQSKSKVFGETDPPLTYSFSPLLIAGDSFTGSLDRTPGQNVGVYAIGQGSLLLDNNYSLTYTSANLSITEKTITVTAVAKSKVFGEIDPPLTYSFSPVLLAGDSFTGALARLTGETVGNYPINQGTLALNNNYTINFTGNNLAITRRVLTITAEAKTKTYGDADPILTYNAVGLAAGDNINGALTRQTGELAGTYQIEQGSLTANNNYTINYIANHLTINKRTIVVTAEAKSKTYGETDPVLTYTFTPALLPGNSFSGNLSRTTGENAGNYQLTQGTLDAGVNYTINYQAAPFVINKALLSVRVNDAQMCQGATLPNFALSYSGFRNGDGENSIASKPIVNTAANSSSTAGSYVLVPSAGTSTNYSFNYVNGALTINALPQLTITSNKGNSLSKGEILVLTASGGTSYNWTGPDDIISGQQSALLSIRPKVSGTYVLTATNASGCSSQQSFSVTVRDDFQAITATNLLSPNGDGINDTWVVNNIDMYPENEIQIFDKAGRVLYRKRTYDNSWDGTVNGNPLAENTYYYIIDFGAGKPKQKGFITIVRQK